MTRERERERKREWRETLLELVSTGESKLHKLGRSFARREFILERVDQESESNRKKEKNI